MINLKIISNLHKYNNGKKQKMENKELFNKNIIQHIYQVVSHKNFIIYYKIKKHPNSLIKFIVSNTNII